MQHFEARSVLAAILLSSMACTTTSIDERMPDAAATVRWTLEHTRSDLTAVAAEAKTSDQLSEQARDLLALECAHLETHFDRAAAELDRAEREVDVEALEAVAQQVAHLADRVSALQRAVLIAEAAAPR